MRPIILLANLVDQHGNSLKTCPGCEICSEITRLRGQMGRKLDPDVQAVMLKGQDMTKSDIEFLLKNNVRRKDIQKAVEMNSVEFYAMLKALGLDAKSMKKRKELEAV